MEILHGKMYILICLFIFIFVNINAHRCKHKTKCIFLEKCPGLYKKLNQGNSTQLTALLQELRCGLKKHINPRICCLPEYLSESIEVTSKPEQEDNFLDPVTLRPSRENEICGYQSIIVDRIFGGTMTAIEEHPWLALLRYDEPTGWGFYCGGVLISQRYVLTAAHCVKVSNPTPSWKLTQVRLGEWNTSSEIDCINDHCSDPVQDIPVENIIIHESYDPDSSEKQNDIALLRLTKAARYNDFVRPVCLPLSDSTLDESHLEVAGWGKTETRSESDVKLKISLPYTSNAKCGAIYNRTNLRITEKQLCAGGFDGKNSCRGDSGGALIGVTSDSSEWRVFGIVSFGPSPCNANGWPSVYTRVTAFMDWILSNILEP